MRKNAAQSVVVKDPVYNSEQVTQLVNKVLLDGKKSTAERIVYGAGDLPREDRHRSSRYLGKGSWQHPPRP